MTGARSWLEERRAEREARERERREAEERRRAQERAAEERRGAEEQAAGNRRRKEEAERRREEEAVPKGEAERRAEERDAAVVRPEPGSQVRTAATAGNAGRSTRTGSASVVGEPRPGRSSMSRRATLLLGAVLAALLFSAGVAVVVSSLSGGSGGSSRAAGSQSSTGKRSSSPPPPSQPPPSPRSPAGPSGTVVDPKTGLVWTDADNGSDIDWNDAKRYCVHLSLGGSSDWRMATIDELEELYDEGESDPCLSSTCHPRLGIDFTGYWIWSSTKKGSSLAWYFSFFNGDRIDFLLDYDDGYRVLCVRGPEPDAPLTHG